MADSSPGRAPARDWAVRPLRPRELLALDSTAAAVLLAVFLTLASDTAEQTVPSWVVPAVCAGMALPVVLRRRWPVAVLVTTAVLSGTAALSGLVVEPLLAVAFTLYGVAVRVRRPRAAGARAIGWASATLLLGVLITGSPAPDPWGLSVLVLGLALCGMSWTAGLAVRERREYAAHSARRLAESAVASERLRIARELHDVVAHHIGVVAVKAGVANHVLSVRPGEAAAALQTIEASSRSALRELRQMLGVLRTEATMDSGEAADGEAALRPAPGLADLPELVRRVTAAGAETELHGEIPPGVPEGVDRSAYRIVQEALTNVLKHAAPCRCQVRVSVDGADLWLEVVDEGPSAERGTDLRGTPRAPHPSSDGGTGHGVIGMRERVALYHGTFDAGPHPTGGFVVRVSLPVGEGGIWPDRPESSEADGGGGQVSPAADSGHTERRGRAGGRSVPR